MELFLVAGFYSSVVHHSLHMQLLRTRICFKDRVVLGGISGTGVCHVLRLWPIVDVG